MLSFFKLHTELEPTRSQTPNLSCQSGLHSLLRYSIVMHQVQPSYRPGLWKRELLLNVSSFIGIMIITISIRKILGESNSIGPSSRIVHKTPAWQIGTNDSLYSLGEGYALFKHIESHGVRLSPHTPASSPRFVTRSGRHNGGRPHLE